MNKRGQITIFIVVAIIIIGTVGLFFSLRGNIQQETLVSPEIEPIYNFVVECIENTGEDAIYWVSQNGGYFFPQEFSTETGIPIYYSNGKSYVPYKEEVEENLAKYIEENLDFCLNDFLDFPDNEISKGEIKSIVRIQESFVVFDVEYPLSILKNGETSRIKEFENIKVSSNIKNVYDVVLEIVQNRIDIKGICLNCLFDMMEENKLTMNMIPSENFMIFTIRDENKINKFPIEWNFANQYE